MRTLIVFLFISMAVSCSKEDNKSKQNNSNMNVDVVYQLVLRNAQGKNLLNPEIDRYFKHNEIMLFSDVQLTTEIKDTLVYETNEGYAIVLGGGGADEMTMNNKKIKYGTVYLRLDSVTVDTIYSESIYMGSSLLLNKVVYNSNEIFSFGNDRFVTVIKE